jgi:hypothetical protein
MKKLILILLVVCYICLSASYGQTLKIRNISKNPKEIKAYNKETREFLWKSVSKTEEYQDRGKTYLKVADDGSGVWGNKRQFRTWHSEAIYLFENERIIPVSSSLIFWDNNGVTVESLDSVYYLEDKKVVCKTLEGKKEFRFDSDLVEKNGLGQMLMNYPYQTLNELFFHMLTNEPTLYKMTVQNKDIEAIIVDNREVECYKLQMIPDLGVLGIFGVFVPKTYFWYKVNEPHEFVRYEGLESGLNTPYIVMEAQN